MFARIRALAELQSEGPELNITISGCSREIQVERVAGCCGP